MLFGCAALPFGYRPELGKTVVMIINPVLRVGGTGVILDHSFAVSHVLTNRHVCKSMSPATFIINEDNEEWLVGSYKESKVTDLCLITVLGDMRTSAKLSILPAKVKDHIVTMGHPRLRPLTVATGNVTAETIMLMDIGAFKCFTTTAQVDFGASGSPVFNDNGLMVGLVFAMDGDRSMAFISLAHIRYFLDLEIPKLLDQYIPYTLLNKDTK